MTTANAKIFELAKEIFEGYASLSNMSDYDEDTLDDKIRAIDLLLDLIERDPENFEYHREIAESCDLIVLNFPDNWEIYHTCKELRDKHYQIAYMLNPDDYRCALGIATIYHEEGNSLQAIEILKTLEVSLASSGQLTEERRNSIRADLGHFEAAVNGENNSDPDGWKPDDREPS